MGEGQKYCLARSCLGFDPRKLGLFNKTDSFLGLEEMVDQNLHSLASVLNMPLIIRQCILC
jgi:hypothetical protein